MLGGRFIQQSVAQGIDAINKSPSMKYLKYKNIIYVADRPLNDRTSLFSFFLRNSCFKSASYE
jgi:hypothetical protein